VTRYKEGKIKSHKDLDVWKRSVELVTIIYQHTKSFPKEEIYGITNQIRRSSISIPSNISEGAGRNHPKEFIQFLHISLGSLSELETQIIISENLKFLLTEDSIKIQNELTELRRMIIGLIHHLKRKN
jgi:four helix bundle protein